MLAFYAQIKLFHIVVALLSGSLFVLRGTFALASAPVPRAANVRRPARRCRATRTGFR